MGWYSGHVITRAMPKLEESMQSGAHYPGAFRLSRVSQNSHTLRRAASAAQRSVRSFCLAARKASSEAKSEARTVTCLTSE
eukprot:4373820-Prymnesium_polylepis.1